MLLSEINETSTDYHQDEDCDAWYQNLTDEIVRTAGHINAMEYHFIHLISDYDEYELWRVESQAVKSFAHWLNSRCGLHPLVAREKIRVARRIRVLPDIDKAFRTGRISYSKVRALTRVATPDNEALLLEQALAMTAAHLELRLRRYRKVDDLEFDDGQGKGPDEVAQKNKPYVSCWQDDEGVFHLHARLKAEDGALVEKAIERMVNSGSSEEPDLLPASFVQEEIEDAVKNVPAETLFAARRSEALVGIAEHFLATVKEGAQCLAGGDRCHLVVHINANEAHQDCNINGGACTYLEKGQFIAPEVAKRLACEASVTTVTEDDHGNVLNIGRRSRAVPRAIDLAVDIRDNATCQHPWCYQTRHTQKHHIKPWAQGGETSARNLITLCQRHHTLQHEGAFEIEHIEHEDGSCHFAFIDRDGEIIERGADPQFPDYKPPDYQFAEEIVPVVELDTALIIGRTPTAFERRLERNARELAALVQFYSS